MATRTVQAAPVQNKHTGKWACCFQMFRKHEGTEYLASELESPALWFDGAAAGRAGQRALEILEATGKYPNMCELW